MSSEVIGAAIRVHRRLGPGLLESAYRACLVHEVRGRGLVVESEVPLDLQYDGLVLSSVYRLDLLVQNELIVELKAVTSLEPIHTAQLLTYLKLSGRRVGLLVNFNVQLLKDGIRRVVLH